MKKRLLVAGGAILAAALIAAPVRGGQARAENHAAMTSMASDARLDELVKKMNATQGQAKVDAMAELLTALVQAHQSMHATMGGMMHNMGEAHGK
jgi:gas vesicle protein